MMGMGYSRVIWGMTGLLWLVIAVLWCSWFGGAAWGVAAVFALLPDIALLGGFVKPGVLRSERIAIYNLMHNALVAVGTLVIGAVTFFITGGMDGGFWGIGLAGLVWFVHIAIHRALGAGPCAPDGTITKVQ